jgi:uncharacterized protein YjbI with pentapeptide repeats
MGKAVKPPSIKPRSIGHHQGLRQLSPDLIGKARDDNAAQVTRIGLTFVGTVAFCLLSLLSPDSALLGGSDKIIVPFAGPVSFLGFMLLGPTVLIMVRVYLQIYVQHGDRLDRLARLGTVLRAPTLLPLENPLIRLFSGLIFYALLPLATLLFALKAAVFPKWGSGLCAVAVAVIVSHVLLPVSKFSWRSKGLLSVGVAILAGGIMLSLGLPHRPFNLFRANLSSQWLFREDLGEADLRLANLKSADLREADLRDADLREANLAGANLNSAILNGANLCGANLSGANLITARLNGANLYGANLNDAILVSAFMFDADLKVAQLRGAHMSGVGLNGAYLNSADLSKADLSGANLKKAHLLGTNLSGADLTKADLRDVDLSTPDLSGANLSGANLGGVDLRDARGLSQTQLDSACGSEETKLAVGLTLKPCPCPWKDDLPRHFVQDECN